MTLSLDTAYRSFGGEVEASSTPTICRLSDSRRHQLWAIARRVLVTVPRDVREWLEERAKYHGSSLSAETVRSIRERMERERAAAATAERRPWTRPIYIQLRD